MTEKIKVEIELSDGLRVSLTLEQAQELNSKLERLLEGFKINVPNEVPTIPNVEPKYKYPEIKPWISEDSPLIFYCSSP